MSKYLLVYSVSHYFSFTFLTIAKEKDNAILSLHFSLKIDLLTTVLLKKKDCPLELMLKIVRWFQTFLKKVVLFKYILVICLDALIKNSSSNL